MSEEQRALTREIAFEVAEITIKRFEQVHIQTCPWGRKLSRWMWIAFGVALGLGVAGYGVGQAIATAIRVAK